MSNIKKILAIGDVVGPAAVEKLGSWLRSYRDAARIDLCLVNGENASVGNGIDVSAARAILDAGADIITTGNHVWHKRDIRSYLDDSDRILRPANYPSHVPGVGSRIIDAGGYRCLCINVLGTTFMEPLACPFATVEKILDRESGRYDFAVLDFHAEATAEKIALATYFDGRIQVIYGTHTHVQTADERILPLGTGYITDLGMTGVIYSALGVRTDCVIEKLTTRLPVRFELAEGDMAICGAEFEVDLDTGRTVKVTRIRVE